MMPAGKSQSFRCGAALRKLLAAAALAGVAWQAVALHGEPSAKKISFDTYRLVKTRNIFDPDRRAMVATPQPQNAKPVTRSDYVALTGIMVTEDKALAFFSGSRSEYNKVLPEKSTIAGATVLRITSANILVERDGKQVTVAVGQTVPLDGSAPAAAPSPPPDAASSSNPNKGSSTGQPPSSTNTRSVDRSETLRRMMERREQQLK